MKDKVVSIVKIKKSNIPKCLLVKIKFNSQLNFAGLAIKKY